jgi:hypothetical protein
MEMYRCVNVGKECRKWLIAGAYKPPSMSNNEFTEHFSRFADISLIHYEHMLLFGDLNFDMLNSDKSATLNKGNNKITELRTILQRESQNS